MDILSLKETAKELTVSRSTLYLLIKDNKLKTITITDKRVGVKREEIQRYLESLNGKH